MKMKNYFVYKIFTDPFIPDFLSGILWEFDIAGLIEEDDNLKIFAGEDSNISIKAIEDSLKKLKEDNLINSFRIEKEILEDKNWNELWEKSREVIKVSERIVVKPSFKKYTAKENEIVLTIDPKMSFGTGEHQSTKLVLRLLEKYVKKGMKVLDVGSGTGVLAIASVKLGATNAVAIDFDETCFDNCNENCVVNEVENSVEVRTGEIKDAEETNFDLILANIHKNVLLEIADEIKKRIRKNGTVIFSGLLNSDQKDIEAKYHSLGFRTEQIEKMDEWIAIVFASVRE
jgi:ribosomal protein L11 methyltransferase